MGKGMLRKVRGMKSRSKLMKVVMGLLWKQLEIEKLNELELR